MRDRRRILEATAAAALLSGAPSAIYSVLRHRQLRPVVRELGAATRAAGTLLPPGRPGLVRGVVAHTAISIACAQILARTLPETHSARWGTAGGLAIGLVNVGAIGRAFPAIRALTLAPQLADNVAFGLIFALVADR